MAIDQGRLCEDPIDLQRRRDADLEPMLHTRSREQ